MPASTATHEGEVTAALNFARASSSIRIEKRGQSRK
jgi:hypothetical protein